MCWQLDLECLFKSFNNKVMGNFSLKRNWGVHMKFWNWWNAAVKIGHVTFTYKIAAMLLTCTLGLLTAGDNSNQKVREAGRHSVPAGSPVGCLPALGGSHRHTRLARNAMSVLIFSCVSGWAEHPNIQSGELDKDMRFTNRACGSQSGVTVRACSPGRRLDHSRQQQLYEKKRNRFRTKFEIVLPVCAAAKGKQKVREMLTCSMTHFGLHYNKSMIWHQFSTFCRKSLCKAS